MSMQIADIDDDTEALNASCEPFGANSGWDMDSFVISITVDKDQDWINKSTVHNFDEAKIDDRE